MHELPPGDDALLAELSAALEGCTPTPEDLAQGATARDLGLTFVQIEDLPVADNPTG